MFKSKLASIIIVVLIACCAIIPTGCNINSNITSEQNEDNGFFSKITIAQSSGDFVHTQTTNSNSSNNPTIPLLSGDIYDVCANYETLITSNYNPEKVDMFAPTPLTISWESKETPLCYVFDIATNANMSNSKSFTTVDNTITLENLFMGYDYYYQIQAKFDDRVEKSKILKFSTSYLPRTVYIDDNVSNTRDWGGYFCGNGTKRVKQGIVYRGGELEHITEQGKNFMLVDLGIKTDLDVRGDGSSNSNTSPLGESVNYIVTKGPYYANTSTGIIFYIDYTSPKRQEYKDALITEIKTFANPDNFPIYVHCSLGRDRTGTICFLINSLLGVNEKDLYIDYELSMMSASGTRDGGQTSYLVGTAFRCLYEYIYYYSSGNLSQNAEKYMLDLGITKEEIASIKANMLEDVK